MLWILCSANLTKSRISSCETIIDMWPSVEHEVRWGKILGSTNQGCDTGFQSSGNKDDDHP